jgi:UDP-2,3-diacylglucosamine hydrolase
LFVTDSIQIVEIEKGKKIFFASDFHLPIRLSSTTNATHREDKILAWLSYIMSETQALFLLGDVFNFWFEYKYLVPKGAIRFQTKLLEFHQAQIPVYFFLGNHDCWSMDYFKQECGVQLFRKPASITICNQHFLVGHGDNINPTTKYAILQRLYKNDFLQSMIRVIPADWLYGMVHRYLLKKEYRIRNNSVLEEKDRIFRYCKDKIEPFVHHDFYIFGHTHVPCIKTLNDSSRYCNLGDWASNCTYACFNGQELVLLKF